MKQNTVSLSFLYFLCALTIRIRRFPAQAPLGARLGLETQSCYEASGEWLGQNSENAVINIRLVRLFPREWPKNVHGAAK